MSTPNSTQAATKPGEDPSQGFQDLGHHNGPSPVISMQRATEECECTGQGRLRGAGGQVAVVKSRCCQPRTIPLPPGSAITRVYAK